MQMYPAQELERAMKVKEVITRAMSGQINWIQAAEILGMSDRQLRRWRQRWEAHGYDGLFDRRTQRPSPKRVPVAEVEQVLRLYRERYFDFNVKHFVEKLHEEHQIELSYTWVKTALQTAGLVQRAPKRGGHRKARPRRPLPGMLLHIDGSSHRWIPGLGRDVDMIVVFDDATSEVYYARLVEEESTATVMAGVKQVVEERGVFCALYSDRASHFVYTPKAGGPPDRRVKTQVERALNQMGIELIAAHSPQARGRCERLFGTWQGRLPQECRLRGIESLEAANAFLPEWIATGHNGRFTVKAEQVGTAFLPYGGRNWTRSGRIRKNASWAMTTRSATTRGSCRCRNRRSASVWPAAAYGSVSIWMERSACTTGPIGSAAMTPQGPYWSARAEERRLQKKASCLMGTIDLRGDGVNTEMETGSRSTAAPIVAHRASWSEKFRGTPLTEANQAIQAYAWTVGQLRYAQLPHSPTTQPQPDISFATESGHLHLLLTLTRRWALYISTRSCVSPRRNQRTQNFTDLL